MSKLTVKIACGLMILLVATTGLAACSGEEDEAVEPSYASEIVEGLLQSLSDGDFDAHIAYYSPEAQSAVVEADFNTSTQEIKAAIGDYINKEFQDTGTYGAYLVVYYIAHFTDEPEDVEVGVYFEEIDGEMYVAGCWLNSPKLIEASEASGE